MKKAFNLTELIFVLVIIGILTGVGFYSFKPNYLRNDTNFVLMKLENIRYSAIGYDKKLENLGSIDYSIGCINIRDLNKTADNTKSKNYKFHSAIDVSPAIEILCFDNLGRIHKGEDDNNRTTLDSLLTSYVIITLKYQDENSTIILNSQSGFIDIKY